MDNDMNGWPPSRVGQEASPYSAIQNLRKLATLKPVSIGPAIVGWIGFLTGRDAHAYLDLPRMAVTADGITGGLTVETVNLPGREEVLHLWHEDLDGMALAMALRQEPEGPMEPLVPGGAYAFDAALYRWAGSHTWFERHDLALAGAREALAAGRLDVFCMPLAADPVKVRELALSARPTIGAVENALGWNFIPAPSDG